MPKLLDQETWDAMKAVGYSEEELLADQPTGPIIYSYTRKQAIEDGVLMDVTTVAITLGYKVPVAMTCGVVEKFNADGLVHVLNTLSLAIRTAPRDKRSDRVYFKVGDVKLWAIVGPGDNGEPVMTIMLEGED